MVNDEILNGFAVFSSAYMKRWLEGHFYDRIFETQFGGKLKTLDKKAKYGIEFGLNLLTAFFDQKLSDDTTLKRFVKEVGLDVGPEVSKRLINNAKEHLSKSANSPEERELVNVLLQLEDQTLIGLLNWLYEIELTQREKVLKQMSSLSLDEVVKLAQLTPENIERLFELINPTSQSKEKRALISPKATQKIGEAAEKIQEIRRKLREKRK